jgi:5-enolpyruvylshikimate-3-phosphate synthase
MCRDSNKRRESIDKDTNKEILHSKGVDLEFNMVSSQLAAMNYAAPLARGLAVVETNPRRKEFRQQTDRKLADLQGQVHQVFFSRYQRQN